MASEGVQLSELGGSRNRYAHFGYEICGTKLEFRATRSSVGASRPDQRPIALTEIDSKDRTTLTVLKQMHDQQVLWCNRPLELFHDYGRNWCRRVYSIREAGLPVGG